MLFTEEELDKLLREGQLATPTNASADNEVDCYGNWPHDIDHMMQLLGYSYGEKSAKEIIVDQRRELFRKTEVEVEKRKHFEEAVEFICCNAGISIGTQGVKPLYFLKSVY